ncbi:MAG: hypothetical protein EOP53_14805 [Sphingobacteriales bacterium]|nr:MAG: hypothetical protein EOP53_14805 [Sphingobacteriales bacterium]
MWRKFNGEILSEDILGEVESAILRETQAGHKLKVCIGSDSQVYGKHTEFATVIVFVRQSAGGFMFIHQERSTQKMSIKERMLSEVAKTIDIAYALCGLLDKYKVELEVHVDINTSPQFKSNSALSDAMGYILSMGFVFKAKPEAFASSYCANKMVN